MKYKKHTWFNKDVGHLCLLSCAGQKCGMCPETATHKVGQDEDEAVAVFVHEGKELRIPHHPLTQYVCCKCFRTIMGMIVQCGKPK